MQLMTKPCPKCQQDLPSERFTVKKTGYLYSWCKSCTGSAARSWSKRPENRERMTAYARKGRLKREYALAPEDYDRLLAEQGYVCKICKGEKDTNRPSFDIDHDHATGRVRGLLCAHCNRMLGQARDNSEILQAAVEYLRASS